MKKFLTGLLCGTALLVATAAASSDTIQATLFPSKVTIHNGDQKITVDGDEMINYNNKAYIPLRTFSEAMGATVDYQYPSESTDGLHKIDIYQSVAPIEWTLERKSVDPFCGKEQPFHITIGVDLIDDKPSDRAFIVSMNNNTDDDITVGPIDLTFQVRSTESNEVVYGRPLPSFAGVIPSSYEYFAKVTWDHIGIDGKEVPPGEYYIEVVRPSTITYKVLDSDEEKTAIIERLGACNLGYFGITLR
ncbi:Uncharacterised protein [Chlamydia abortus]|nr:Uncharacterised protein [Chlamydia abortus]